MFINNPTYIPLKPNLKKGNHNVQIVRTSQFDSAPMLSNVAMLIIVDVLLARHTRGLL